jgi:hypothetical protein
MNRPRQDFNGQAFQVSRPAIKAWAIDGNGIRDLDNPESFGAF